MSYHVVPINDLEEHELSSSCKCNPKLTMENNEMIFIHNSYDLREIIEEVDEILNPKKT